MAEYGSGVSMVSAFAMDRERIEHALAGELVCGETEDGFEYAPCSQEDANAYILSTFDNTVHTCLNMNASALALERILKEYGKYSLSDYFPLYMRFMNEEIARIMGDEDSQKEPDAQETDLLKDFAKRIGGMDYEDFSRTSPKVRAYIEEANEKGIVILYGLSDDLLEFDGAYREEADCWIGPNEEYAVVSFDETGHAVVAFPKDEAGAGAKDHGNSIKVYWCRKKPLDPEYYKWSFETEIPHEEFDIYEDEELWCQGMVFFLRDMKT